MNTKLYSHLGTLALLSAIALAPSDTGSTGNAEAPKEEAKKKDDFNAADTKYFPPSMLAEAGPYASRVSAYCEANKIPQHMNFDPSVELPSGFGLLIQPVQKRKEKKTKDSDEDTSLILTDVIIAAVPDLSAIMADEKGLFYLREVLRDDFGRTLKQKVVAGKKAGSNDQSIASSLPATIAGFIEAVRARSPLYTFNQIQERIRKALDKKGVKLSKEMLQGVLQSETFAKQFFPNTAQTQWQLVIDRSIQIAQAENLDPGIFVQWKENRDKTNVQHTEEFNLDDVVI